ncbi:NUP57 [Candida oxycetoniae]|uniref:NUP57 n=1 Tax=Candida oxycetoniae TaxID=497107 RepID=A0AAI9T104_9ASCO|nr:NUP57 [Candida oxycetoniae]KAI3406440.2 NUP57 [Candida oxycetoniae]
MFGTSSNSGTGGGLFGSSNANSNSNSNTFGGGIFGNRAASTSFGSQQQQQQPQQQSQQNAFGQSGTSGGLFGQSQSNNTGSANTGLFGSSQPKSSGGLLFGSNQLKSTTPTTNIFGSNTGNSAFGKPAGTSTGGGLFGNTQQSGTGAIGGLFGNTQQSGTGATGGLFGNTQQSGTGATGGLFGNTQQSGTGATGGLFGNTQQSGTGATGGLFGNTQQSGTGATGGLFGNTQQSGTGATGGLFGGNQGGLFGSSNNQSGTLFGSKPATTTTGGTLFGQQQQQQPQQIGVVPTNTTNYQQPSFSWSQSQQSNVLNFNQNQTKTLGQSVNQQPNPNQYLYTPAINDQLAKIWEQWDPNSAKCGLKTHFYNKFDDQQINQLLLQPRPANETVEDWDKAMAERPGPNFYPQKITSFTEVAQRIEAQLNQVAKSRVILNTINERLNTLSAKHDLENTTRILKAKARHTQLSRRVLRLATVLAILKLKGYPLLPEEEEIAKQFDILTSKINDPNSPIGKLSDIFAKLAILKERAEDLNSQFDQSMHSLNGSLSNDISAKEQAKEDSDNNEDAIDKIAKILLRQQMGLNYLNDVLEKDSEKVKKLVEVKSK